MTQIAEAGPAYTDVLAALHARCFEKPWKKEAFADLLNIPGMIALIALRDEEPAGFILAQTAAGEAEVITIGILPEFRRTGLASDLLEALLDKVPDLVKLFIEVDEINAGARSFYTRAGFSPNGRRKNYYRHQDGTRSDAVMMALDQRLNE